MWCLFVSCSQPPLPVTTPEPLPVVAPAPPPPEIPLDVPADANVLASRLLKGERAIRDPASDDATAARWGHATQRVYRRLAEDQVLAGAVVSKIPEELAEVVKVNIASTAAIGRTVPRPMVDLPPWRIVAAPDAATLLGYYREAEALHGVRWSVLAAIHLHETRMGRLRGTSPAGAQGPMQFMPPTWKAYGTGDVNDPRDAILAAGNYLGKMGFSKDERKAVWHYNHHEGYVSAVLDIASLIANDERAYRGYWGWEVYYRTVAGAIWLSEGYEQTERVSIETWCESRGEPHCPTLHPAPAAPPG